MILCYYADIVGTYSLEPRRVFTDVGSRGGIKPAFTGIALKLTCISHPLKLILETSDLFDKGVLLHQPL